MHWTAAFWEVEAALERFARGDCTLVVSLEANDPASLHLIRHVWPNDEVQSLLAQPDVCAIRIDTAAAGRLEAEFWGRELSTGGVLPTIAIASSGARGASCVRERRLAPDYLCRRVRVARGASTDGAERGGHARGAALLEAYRSGRARAFRPPTPPPTQLEIDRSIVAEIDAAYAASLAADEAAERAAEEAAAMERAEAEERAERERVKDAARAARAAARAALAEHRMARATELPDEPPADAAAASTTTIAVRLRDGQRVSRRFCTSSPLSHVFDWVGGVLAPTSTGTFHLASHYPRRQLGEDDAERAMPLAELGLCPAATLFLEEDDEDEDDADE